MITETITWVHHWSDRTFSFKTTRSKTFKFNAGEFVMVGLVINGKNVVKAYSVVSPPWADELEFLSIKIPDGELTSQLQQIRIGDEVIINPESTGTLRNDALNKGGELYLLATGTGLAPFMSLIRDVETLKTWNKINIVHSVRNRDDLVYYDLLSTGLAGDDLEKMVKPILNYIPIVTEEGDKCITAQLGDTLKIDPVKDKIMICGNLDFNRKVAAWCKAKGMKEGSLQKPGDYVIQSAFVEK